MEPTIIEVNLNTKATATLNQEVIAELSESPLTEAEQEEKLKQLIFEWKG